MSTIVIMVISSLLSFSVLSLHSVPFYFTALTHSMIAADLVINLNPSATNFTKVESFVS